MLFTSLFYKCFLKLSKHKLYASPFHAVSFGIQSTVSHQNNTKLKFIRRLNATNDEIAVNRNHKSFANKILFAVIIIQLHFSSVGFYYYSYYLVVQRINCMQAKHRRYAVMWNGKWSRLAYAILIRCMCALCTQIRFVPFRSILVTQITKIKSEQLFKK